MMNKLKFLIVLLAFTGCKSISPIYQEDRLEQINKLGYVLPVYEYHKNLKKYKGVKNYEKYSDTRVDSLFMVEAKKYKISKKVSKSKGINTEIQSLFNTLRAKQKVRLSSVLKSFLEDSNEKHIMMLFFKPKIIIIGNSFPIVTASKMEVVVIETNTEEIIFYDSAYSSIRHPAKRLINNLDDIYRKLDK